MSMPIDLMKDYREKLSDEVSSLTEKRLHLMNSIEALDASRERRKAEIEIELSSYRQNKMAEIQRLQADALDSKARLDSAWKILLEREDLVKNVEDEKRMVRQKEAEIEEEWKSLKFLKTSSEDTRVKLEDKLREAEKNAAEWSVKKTKLDSALSECDSRKRSLDALKSTLDVQMSKQASNEIYIEEKRIALSKDIEAFESTKKEFIDRDTIVKKTSDALTLLHQTLVEKSNSLKKESERLEVENKRVANEAALLNLAKKDSSNG